MERRNKERRRGVNARQDTLHLLQQAKRVAGSDSRTRQLVAGINRVIEELEDITVTLEKRKSERRDTSAPRMLRLAGA